MSISQTGRKHSDITKEKISKSHLGIRSHETPLYLLNQNLEIINNFNNVEECSKFVGICTRNVYDAIKNYRFVKRNFWIIKQNNSEFDISNIKLKL